VVLGDGSGDQRGTGPAFAPRAFEANVRKFSGYVLVPGHESGKDRIFLDRLGFRPRNAEDARLLASIYLDQARSAIARGNVELGETNQYGVRCTIVVRLRGVAIRSGWLLRPNGMLELVTPFSGFAGSRVRSP
jgi:hypothetical protein